MLKRKTINEKNEFSHKKQGLGKTIAMNWQKYVLIAPYTIFYTLFILIPIIAALILSFTNFNMLQFPGFVGLNNYIRLFLDDDVFLKAAQNTMIFAFLTGPVSFLAAFILAWFINELNPKMRAFMTLVFYSPSLAGNVFFIWAYLFSGDMYGLVNSMLMRTGIIIEPVQWLTDPRYNMGVIIIVQLWLSLGAGFLAFIAGLQSIDRSMYESGAIDGIRNRLQELWYITLPAMKPLLMFGAIMQIAATFAVSEVPMALAGFPSTDDSAATIVSHVIDHGTLRYEMGYASAIATILFGVMIITKVVISSIIGSDEG